jgi:hypothetical protein
MPLVYQPIRAFVHELSLLEKLQHAYAYPALVPVIYGCDKILLDFSFCFAVWHNNSISSRIPCRSMCVSAQVLETCFKDDSGDRIDGR